MAATIFYQYQILICVRSSSQLKCACFTTVGYFCVFLITRLPMWSQSPISARTLEDFCSVQVFQTWSGYPASSPSSSIKSMKAKV